MRAYQARWLKCESTEQAITSQLMARNSSTLSLKAMISVGQTNVLKKKQMQITNRCKQFQGLKRLWQDSEIDTYNKTMVTVLQLVYT